MQEAGWLAGHWCCSLFLLPDGWERSTPPGVPESGLRAVCVSEPHSWVESLLPCPAGFLGYRFWATEDDFFSGWGLESGLGPFFGHQPGSKDLEKDPTEGHPCPASSSLPRKASELLGGGPVFFGCHCQASHHHFIWQLKEKRCWEFPLRPNSLRT